MRESSFPIVTPLFDARHDPRSSEGMLEDLLVRPGVEQSKPPEGAGQTFPHPIELTPRTPEVQAGRSLGLEPPVEPEGNTPVRRDDEVNEPPPNRWRGKPAKWNRPDECERLAPHDR